jgi:hypothetical protein
MRQSHHFIASALVIVLLSFGGGNARANTVTFNATGTFSDGANLSGTITIDNSLGVVTMVDLIISAPDAATFNVIGFQAPDTPTTGQYDIEAYKCSPTSNCLYPWLQVVLPVSSLIGYNGGIFVAPSALYPSEADSPVVLTGSLTGTETPIPSSLPLFATGLGALGLLASRKKRKSAALAS